MVLIPDYIDIRYMLTDRYGVDSPEPNDQLESITGVITMQVADGEAQPIGELSLARIDLWEHGLDLFGSWTPSLRSGPRTGQRSTRSSTMASTSGMS
jgi:hypothetical protein